MRIKEPCFIGWFITITILILSVSFTFSDIAHGESWLEKKENYLGVDSIEQYNSEISLDLTNRDPIIIENDNNFTDYSFPGTGTSGDPYRIENFNITTSGDYGIYISGISKHFVVQNCFINANLYGIYFGNSITSGIASILDNYLTGNIVGIHIFIGVTSPQIMNNTCVNNNGGIGVYSPGASIKFNDCSYNTYGIRVSASSVALSENTCNHNSEYGIRFNVPYSTVRKNVCNYNMVGIVTLGTISPTLKENLCNFNSKYGIELDSSGVYVEDNIIMYNQEYGVYATESDCTISGNLIQNNTLYGVYLEDTSSSNEVSYNTFAYNNVGGSSQGYDDGSNNDWYYTLWEGIYDGNWWSDYDNSGTYSIEGSAGSVDLAPLDEPTMEIVNEYHALNFVLLVSSLSFIIILGKKKKIHQRTSKDKQSQKL